ncbi:MAG: acyl-CoA synthetase [Xanthomonadales bacterium]|nr:acyl-CoA synthetase [Xanthomonadales bacterium]
MSGDAGRPVLYRRGRALPAGQFLARALALAERLPPAPSLINLCEDRGHFLVAFCAALLSGRTTLLPPARTEKVVAEITADWAPAAIIDDADVAAACAMAGSASAEPAGLPGIPLDRVVAIGFTSGSTGRPRANPKTWGAFAGTTRRNDALLRSIGSAPGAAFNLLATVPSQHMYGMETCVLLPVLGDAAVAVERPLFPQDLAQALADLPAPRLLVTTPVHLRALVGAGIAFPPVAALVSATAPLDPALARRAEEVFAAPLVEMFGSTETCVIGHRRPTADPLWQPYPGLHLSSCEAGTRVQAPWLSEAVLLQDHLRFAADGRFEVVGRCQDMIEIAGKRASLGDITRRLLAIPGIEDAIVFQAAQADASGVCRIEAAVVAGAVSDATVLAELRGSLDPVFLPRRLHRFACLPRNETGKLCREALLAGLGAGTPPAPPAD